MAIKSISPTHWFNMKRYKTKPYLTVLLNPDDFLKMHDDINLINLFSIAEIFGNQISISSKVSAREHIQYVYSNGLLPDNLHLDKGWILSRWWSTWKSFSAWLWFLLAFISTFAYLEIFKIKNWWWNCRKEEKLPWIISLQN